MKHLTRNEMKNVMGGVTAPVSCTPGTTINGFNGGGGHPCTLDLLVCDGDCRCIQFCDRPYDASFCDNFHTIWP